MIRFSSLRTCARAYFADDKEAIETLMPNFYTPTAATLDDAERLSSDARLKGSTLSGIKGNLSKWQLKAPDGWYRTWVGEKGVPKDGLPL